MNSRRLARLMGIICDIKAHPRLSPEEMCDRYQVSRRQFYKDRDLLSGMGFAFHFSRGKDGFILDKELTCNIQGLSLADLFALVLAVRQLTQLSDFALAMGALAGLRTMVHQLPDPLRPVFSDVVDQVVVADGFNCRPEVLAELQNAIQGGWRAVVVMEGAGQDQRLNLKPQVLLLRDGRLFLEAEGLEDSKSSLLALSRVRKVIPMSLFRQTKLKPAS